MITSKAETLRYLTPLLKKSKIEKMYFFSVKDWNVDQKRIINDISKYFKSTIIIRSSAIGEDSIVSSQAGLYTSVLNINPKKQSEVKNGVNKVIQSYKEKNLKNKITYNLQPEKLHNVARQKIEPERDQILIQIQTKSIDTSGVILSREPNSGAPYYIINYEQDDSTDSVTKGISNNLIKIHRDVDDTKIPKHWKKLISSVKEIEKILKNNKLDIEFAINKKQEIIIFQVRVLTQLFGKDYTNEDIFVRKNLKKITKDLGKNNHEKILLSDMADWNPAEIIGANPNPLSYSLYNSLIMNYSWYKGRMNIGYRKPLSNNLMYKIGNKPFVKLENSFSSFFPDLFSEKLRKKLLKYYVKKIENEPFLHDKIEFFIIFSCYDLSVPKRLKELKKFGFSENEIQTVKKETIRFTNNIINNFDFFLNECRDSIFELEKRRTRETKNIHSNVDHKHLLNKTKILLEDCKKFGAVPFASMARLAFIASALLKSMLDQKIINSNEYYTIFSTVESPMIEFQKDLELFRKKKITRKKFLAEYGHLRPGTYDITVKRYDQNRISLKPVNIKKKASIKNLDNFSIDKILKENGLEFNFKKLILFIQQALYYREKFKMEFSKNISDSLELILSVGKKLNLTREEISFLEINSILDIKNNLDSTKKNWMKKIEKNKEIFLQNELILLPSFINSKNNFLIVENFRSKPNFITKKSIVSEIIELNRNIVQDVKHKIIVIENADPGFDWIFSKQPAGLITKFGGLASHMAIRCSEIGLPAAIGCGQSIFSKIENARRIKLDCKNEQISLI